MKKKLQFNYIIYAIKKLFLLISKKEILCFGLFMVLSILFQELVLRLFLGASKSLWLLFFNCIWPLFIYGILLSLKPSNRVLFSDYYHLIMLLFFGSQFLHFRFFRNFYSFSMMKNAPQLLQFTGDAIKLLISNIFFVFLLLIPLLAYAFYFRNILHKLPTKKFGYLLSGSSILLGLVLHLVMGQLSTGLGSPYELYHLHSSMMESTKEFGLVSSMGIDLRKRIFGEVAPSILAQKQEKEKKKENIKTQSVEQEKPQDQIQVAQMESDSEKLVTPLKLFQSEPQILNIDFAELEEQRESGVIADIDNYFKKVEPSYKNEYSGRFKGYNFIFITAESLWAPAIDPVLTPTLYKMKTEGIHLTDFYNPLWTASTSDGEYMGLVGLLPKDGVWSVHYSSKNFMPQAMGWRMKEAGYHTYAYHNHDYHYYDRDKSHPNLGYDYKGLGSGVEVKETWPESDLEMMKVTMEEYLNQEPFHAYYMSVSGHSGYSFESNAMALKNQEYVKDLNMSEEGKAYIAANLEFEHAMTYLLRRLEEGGIAEKTLIVINPDHYPYALNEETQDELGGKPSWPMERYKSVGIIYAQGMEPLTWDKPVSSIDLLPTAYNLLGIDYDSRLLMGRDIFHDDPLVVFYNRSWITNKGYFDVESGVFTPRTGQALKEDYEDTIHQKVREQFYYSAQILDVDYFDALPKEAFIYDEQHKESEKEE